MEETISLKDIIKTLKKRLFLIVCITVSVVAVSALVTYFLLTPKYEASTQLLVNQSFEEGQQYTSAEVRTNLDLINTYNVIITSPRILEPALEELGLERSRSDLRNQVRVTEEGESQVVSITVQDPDPAMAVNIANTLALVFQRDIVDIMNVDNVSILSSAELVESSSPISPNPPLNMAIAFVVGLMAAVGIAFILEFLDNTIKTEDDVEDKLGIPVLASISTIDATKVTIKEISHNRRSRTGRETYGA
ncbi:capsular biosynthesis protein [Salipaludibacillus agaradhaerens]|uniref:YveK family protein n=1 Tax=Salipaludibacillus agaradhaerens TaxID=76935 RepID=UPI0021517417|nr:Wzz/FepE/Etk N-terminal domain-containing protein [Salipaludibacillus agaradhaerens]MCR6108138.1 capsular biosynthesis protein [Salipaludibacillus agaradhaerens]MCR6120163.1 capsular biosynthesis protein [Salipaludibacillus agaradhaerens]